MPPVSKLVDENAVSRHTQRDEGSASLFEGQAVPARDDSFNVDKEGNFQDLWKPQVKSMDLVQRQIEQAQAGYSELIENLSNEHLPFQHGDVLSLQSTLMPADFLTHLRTES